MVQDCYLFYRNQFKTNVCWCQVKQLLAADGRLHTKFDIASTGSAQNYTRSYYMNGRDYIISGSCDEPVVRVCCAQTGRRLRDIYLEVHLFSFHILRQNLVIFLKPIIVKIISARFKLGPGYFSGSECKESDVCAVSTRRSV